MKLYESNVIISQNGEEAFPLYFIYPENNLNAYMCGLFSRRPQKKKRKKMPHDDTLFGISGVKFLNVIQ